MLLNNMCYVYFPLALKGTHHHHHHVELHRPVTGLRCTRHKTHMEDRHTPAKEGVSQKRNPIRPTWPYLFVFAPIGIGESLPLGGALDNFHVAEECVLYVFSPGFKGNLHMFVIYVRHVAVGQN